MFHHCFIESVLSFSSFFACMGNDQRAGIALNDLLDLHKSRSVQKAQLIRSDPSHPLNTEFMLLPLDTLCQSKTAPAVISTLNGRTM